MKLPLTTPRLLLRRFRTEDLPSFSHYRNLSEVARFQIFSKALKAFWLLLSTLTGSCQRLKKPPPQTFR